MKCKKKFIKSYPGIIMKLWVQYSKLKAVDYPCKFLDVINKVKIKLKNVIQKLGKVKKNNKYKKF